MAGRFIDVVSDSTGETAEKVVRAALLQFPQAGAVIRLHTRVRTKEIARTILERSSKEGALFVFTVVSPELREYIHASTSELKVDAVDVIGSLIGKLGHFLDREPINLPSSMLPPSALPVPRQIRRVIFRPASIAFSASLAAVSLGGRSAGFWAGCIESLAMIKSSPRLAKHAQSCARSRR